MLRAEQIAQFKSEGYTTVKSLFSQSAVSALIDHYMKLRLAGSYFGDFDGVDTASSDPLKKYPRMINMHRWDEMSLQWLLDARIGTCLTEILGCEPFAVQTMLYFKPPGARGQALHQDQFYLRVKPGTCVAAWLALDDADEQNGCMRLVPGTSDIPILCTEMADTSISFTDVTVPVPESLSVEPVFMNAGDVLFFNGSVIHGSYPNVSADRFRRSLIGHYITGTAEQVGSFYHPVLRMDGSEVKLRESEHGGPCGIWSDIDGATSVRMESRNRQAVAAHE